MRGLQEGWELGVQKGTEISTEIGHYLGFVAVWLALLRKDSSSKPRVFKSLESLQSMLVDYPLSDPTYEKLLDDLDAIRAKFKQVRSVHSLAFEQNMK